MADKSLSELIAATSLTPLDLWLIEQAGVAKSVSGQLMINFLTAAADGHGGIQSVEKLPSSGLTDTYRITLADTNFFDFTVTNGKGITGISKTDTSGLVDIYTITYNDGPATTFTVTNGRSIAEVKKIDTSGLVDTYAITYNDGPATTFTVTNGDKGDKGDTPHIWIRYASQKPTDSSPSFGLLPDDWMGQAVNYNDTAPTDWKEYEWFKIKGEKGDPGAPATLVSHQVLYQASTYGTVPPSGTWSETVPSVAQGRYLWTRVTATFNTGEPVVSYSVARMGMDGSGSVSSVNEVSPDSNGNVTLSADGVGALPTSGGSMTGAIDMDGHTISGLNLPTEDTQAANKGYVDGVVRKAHPRNLLDNSCFCSDNVVNQAGVNGLHGNIAYVCDRWLSERADYVTAEQLSDAMKISFSGNSTVMQKLKLTYGKIYTAAVKVRNVSPGSMLLVQTLDPYTTYIHTNLQSGINVFSFTASETADVLTRFAFFGTSAGDSIEVEWAALYEGEYTAETIPEYQPKGYGAELLECQRYYQIRSTNNIAAVDMRPTMRLRSPTITSVTDGYAYSADL